MLTSKENIRLLKRLDNLNTGSMSTIYQSKQALMAASVGFVILSLFLLKSHYSLFGSTQSDNMFVYLAQSFLVFFTTKYMRFGHHCVHFF
jgi:hypothetical protein